MTTQTIRASNARLAEECERLRESAREAVAGEAAMRAERDHALEDLAAARVEIGRLEGEREPDWSQAWGPPLSPDEEAKLGAMAEEMGRSAGRYLGAMLGKLVTR